MNTKNLSKFNILDDILETNGFTYLYTLGDYQHIYEKDNIQISYDIDNGELKIKDISKI